MAASVMVRDEDIEFQLVLRQRMGDPLLFRESASAWDQFRDRYYDAPVLFASECITWPEGDGLADYQNDILQGVADVDRYAIRGPRGMGKTSTIAIMILWYALTRHGYDWKVVTSASWWRQLKRYLWPEIHKWVARLKWRSWAPDVGIYGVPRSPLNRDELLKMEILLEGGVAFAVATNDSNSIEGAHADYVLCLFDESKAVPDSIWDSVEGVFSSCKEGKWVAASTPGPPSGRFYDIFKGRAGLEDWVTRVVTVTEAVAAGRISQRWVDGRLALWGKDSPFYRQQVLAEFAVEVGNALIPLSWVEHAQGLWDEWNEGGRLRPNGTPSWVTSIGVDVGGGALHGDKTTIATVYDGHIIGEIEVIENVPDPEEALFYLGAKLMEYLAEHRQALCFIDSAGIGAGLYQYVRGSTYGSRVMPWNSAFGTPLKDEGGLREFLNWRAAAWLMLREAMQPQRGLGIALPHDQALMDELTIIQPKSNNLRDQRRVEKKEDIRKRLHRSTDCADACLHGLMGRVLTESVEQGGTYITVTPSQYSIG